MTAKIQRRGWELPMKKGKMKGNMMYDSVNIIAKPIWSSGSHATPSAKGG